MQFEYMCCLLGGPVTLEMLKALLKANAGKWMRQQCRNTNTRSMFHPVEFIQCTKSGYSGFPRQLIFQASHHKIDSVLITL